MRFGQTGAKQGKKTFQFGKAFEARVEDYDPDAVGYVQPISARPAGVPPTSGTPGVNWPQGVALIARPVDQAKPEASENETEQEKKQKKKKQKK